MCGFPAHGSHRVRTAEQFAARIQAPVPREPGAESSACFARTRSPRSLPFHHSAADRSALFAGFTATMAGLDFSYPYITGYGSSPSRCGPSLSRDTDGRTRDLPASDAIPSHVMWP
jgi:hypothetical protein